ncbi:hypothetical protein TrVFT333_007078 [Trichoderma virens FT-333]|nr:hypothetical protein TrVFT333_007078 [Trichoderma virens FT-333]
MSFTKTPPVVETDWKKTISTERGFGLGVYAQFLLATVGLPLGPEVNVERSNKTANAFAFDTVTTLAFEPTQEYVQEAIKAPAVQTWLREPRQKFSPVVSLFLVTGLKLVKGARIKYSTSRSTTATGNIGIDVPALGTTFGPKGHWVTANDDQTEFNRESEFVFAFRVKRLKFGRRLKVEDYNKGAFLAVDGGQEDGESVLVEDVDGSEIKTAKAVPDVTENGNVYCVPA